MSKPDLYHQLGLMNVSWERVEKLFDDLHKIANAQHSMGAQAKLPIVNEKGEWTGKRLCYDCGIDGTDGRYRIEDIPDHHIDWDCTEEEWEELRAALWRGWVLEDSYLAKLRRAGKLGPQPKAAGSHVVFAGGEADLWGCSCGHTWRNNTAIAPARTGWCSLDPRRPY